MNHRIHNDMPSVARAMARAAMVRLLTAVLAAVVLPCVATIATAETPALSEYQVKALFLFNFAKYVDWPPHAFADDSAPIVIGLVGQDNFGDNFKQAITGKTINGRPVVVKHVSSEQEYKGCHILFISASEKSGLPEILNAVKDSPVLTVGETERFLAQTGMINFTKKENKIRLEINLGAVQRANLKISSKLLSVADVVMGKPGDEKVN
ncbi:MAG: YfiR family protein [Verrucomicrobiia bacterium]